MGLGEPTLRLERSLAEVHGFTHTLLLSCALRLHQRGTFALPHHVPGDCMRRGAGEGSAWTSLTFISIFSLPVLGQTDLCSTPSYSLHPANPARLLEKLSQEAQPAVEEFHCCSVIHAWFSPTFRGSPAFFYLDPGPSCRPLQKKQTLPV